MAVPSFEMTVVVFVTTPAACVSILCWFCLALQSASKSVSMTAICITERLRIGFSDMETQKTCHQEQITVAKMGIETTADNPAYLFYLSWKRVLRINAAKQKTRDMHLP